MKAFLIFIAAVAFLSTFGECRIHDDSISQVFRLDEPEAEPGADSDDSNGDGPMDRGPFKIFRPFQLFPPPMPFAPPFPPPPPFAAFMKILEKIRCVCI